MHFLTKDRNQIILPFKNWSYDSKLRDWVDTDTGQIMTNYIPDWELETILENIDIKCN